MILRGGVFENKCINVDFLWFFLLIRLVFKYFLSVNKFLIDVEVYR